MKKIFIIFFVIALLSCAKNEQHSEKINVLVTILPQKEFVESVAGKNVDIHVLVPPGNNPASYEPNPDDLQKIEQADIYFLIGHLPFERSHREKIQNLNTKLQIVNTSREIDLRYFGTKEKHNHSEDKMIDPHTWTSPLSVKKQITIIQRTLSKFDPARAAQYKKNSIEYQSKLDSLHINIQKELKNLKNRNLMVFHPAWGYFARDFNLHQIAIEQDGKEPTSKQLHDLIRKAKTENIRVIFVQKQFDERVAKAIAENIDGVVVAIDPLAADYLSNMKKLGETISGNLDAN